MTSCRPLRLTHDPGDADSGGLLEVAGYGQGSHHRCQVGPGSFAGVVEDGASSQVVLAHTERSLDVPLVPLITKAPRFLIELA